MPHRTISYPTTQHTRRTRISHPFRVVPPPSDSFTRGRQQKPPREWEKKALALRTTQNDRSNWPTPSVASVEHSKGGKRSPRR
ncbi:uncharacterized protein BCR38DRAFT_129536 [Pseudomassariella vexata]|uniref:Uncharacterized protein n=1 Tax=Pseudomassariella vexata TaxID=1141098 RepID=A0A1Y2E9R5_9PEZI|nr:uncharacterized protein BCR38DRAFT_129536 [Pseudomassariella vexata]ORY68282.1 hypothetical protein BCR38DRAFT_129536 [Pseudomassariella vexata]